MLTGVEYANMDAKGRVPVPARLRAALMERCDGDIVITTSLNSPCLVIYPIEEWRKLEQQFLTMPSLNPKVSASQRLLMGYANAIKLDASGRILVSKSLRERAVLEKETAFVGQVNRIEVWHKEAWDKEVVRSLQVLQSSGDDLPMELASLTGIS
ncbi:MAG: division/cell wall cluster transcriptional repressor MraZ [Gammaproteobacteria bacterium]|nr:MAG: division/cell wall cluster transcriptional repressor MraZ [Gammaproteobacteria bacterium]PIE37535.1 MAG: division/cell wall cluster transcriptional repressor MraZ [Gammaproteobacteria bacterium]